MRHLTLLPALLLLGLTTGCASVISGSHQQIRVETDPPGATATGAGQAITTPGTISFRRNATDLDVVVEKEGYIAQRVTLTKKENGNKWVNLALAPVGVAAGVYTIGSLPPSSEDPLLVQVSEAVFGTQATWGAIFGILLPAAGFAIDHVTGAAYKLDPPRIVLKLEPESPESPGDDGVKPSPVPAELTRADLIDGPADSGNGIRLPEKVLMALRPR